MCILYGNSVSKHLRPDEKFSSAQLLPPSQSPPDREGPVRLTKEGISRDLDCRSLRPPGETVLAAVTRV